MRGVYLRGFVAAGMVATGMVVPPAVASATTGSTLYVDNTNSCSDSGSGTSTAPFCTIAAAAAVAQPGQTVQVSSGVYAPTTITRSGTTRINALLDR